MKKDKSCSCEGQEACHKCVDEKTEARADLRRKYEKSDRFEKAMQDFEEGEEIDEIIDFLEEHMDIDGLPVMRMGHEDAEYPDVRAYLKDRIEARVFIIAKFKAVVERLYGDD